MVFALGDCDAAVFPRSAIKALQALPLVESGAARPAPYLARAKWVRVDSLAALDAAEMTDWLANAHALVAAKLTRATRRSLGLPV